jgi:MinD superfamily P-loop ATPase
MILAVASGKGGTGKTTLAVNLAVAAARMNPGPVRLLDCDVEEPNCALFVKPEFGDRAPVRIPVPVLDAARCEPCGQCAKICQYHAIAYFGRPPTIFPDLCHGCGGCMLVCPTGALREEGLEIGVVEQGARAGLELVQGRLMVGKPLSPPIIHEVRKRIRPDGLNVLDCPPGNSCPLVATLRGVDFVLLAAEPTRFGVHDMGLVVETLRHLGLPFGVVVNRDVPGERRLTDFCSREGIDILARIPDDRRIAEACSRGEVLVDVLPELGPVFEALWRACVAARGG